MGMKKSPAQTVIYPAGKDYFFYFKDGRDGMAFPTANMRVETCASGLLAERRHFHSLLKSRSDRADHFGLQAHDSHALARSMPGTGQVLHKLRTRPRRASGTLRDCDRGNSRHKNTCIRTGWGLHLFNVLTACVYPKKAATKSPSHTGLSVFK